MRSCYFESYEIQSRTFREGAAFTFLEFFLGEYVFTQDRKDCIPGCKNFQVKIVKDSFIFCSPFSVLGSPGLILDPELP